MYWKMLKSSKFSKCRVPRNVGKTYSQTKRSGWVGGPKMFENLSTVNSANPEYTLGSSTFCCQWVLESQKALHLHFSSCCTFILRNDSLESICWLLIVDYEKKLITEQVSSNENVKIEWIIYALQLFSNMLHILQSILKLKINCNRLIGRKFLAVAGKF